MFDTKYKVEKQESLPFPPTPSASIAGRIMQESVYKQRVTPRRLPADAPNILIILIDDVGPGTPVNLRRRNPYTFIGSHCKTGSLVQPIPFHRHVFAHTCCLAYRTQPHIVLATVRSLPLQTTLTVFSGVIPKYQRRWLKCLNAMATTPEPGASGIILPRNRLLRRGRLIIGPPVYGFEYFYGFLAGEASQYEPNSCPQHELCKQASYIRRT